MVDVCAEQGWLASTLRLQQLMQMVSQGRWLSDSPLTVLPHLERQHLHMFSRHQQFSSLPALMTASYAKLVDILQAEMAEGSIQQVTHFAFLNFKYLSSDGFIYWGLVLMFLLGSPFSAIELLQESLGTLFD